MGDALLDDKLQRSHTRDAIRLRMRQAANRGHLSDWVLGGIDGCVTTFAVVAGAVGGSLSTKIIVVLGLANLLADGFSMAASNYLSVKSERQLLERTRREEEQHIAQVPEGEREEIRQIFLGGWLPHTPVASSLRPGIGCPEQPALIRPSTEARRLQ